MYFLEVKSTAHPPNIGDLDRRTNCIEKAQWLLKMFSFPVLVCFLSNRRPLGRCLVCIKNCQTGYTKTETLKEQSENTKRTPREHPDTLTLPEHTEKTDIQRTLG